MIEVREILNKLDQLVGQNVGLFKEFEKMRRERDKAVEEVKKANIKLFLWMKICTFTCAGFLAATGIAIYIALHHWQWL